jgi:hypothetical protein
MRSAVSRDDAAKESFGCGSCWPPGADAAWKERATLTQTAELIDESHFHVMVLVCPRCTQSFLSVFTETVDWEDGDDPQFWTLMPITSAEVADLIGRGGSLTEADLRSLGPGRRCLRRDHPKASTPISRWGTGLFVGPHD